MSEVKFYILGKVTPVVTEGRVVTIVEIVAYWTEVTDVTWSDSKDKVKVVPVVISLTVVIVVAEVPVLTIVTVVKLATVSKVLAEVTVLPICRVVTLVIKVAYWTETIVKLLKVMTV